jgi:hypothetical protein
LIAKANLENRSGEDFCLEGEKIEVQKMIDLQKKYAIISNILQMQHQARSHAFSTFLFNGSCI